ncbi:ABC transporter substrate-binding protein [Dehalobacterium formicoaceticum]|uniref:ABC transporter substrate-binding protein n=1 Tax=Dehalobacterium formicoaceticum TaxID=51515 RepID=UPI000B7D44C1|nr:MetQ/NlpA family ABC transporter substrate-binding protein [Dehalobacterium formicoaceticum]
MKGKDCRKRKIGFLLAMILALTLLAGCGQEKAKEEGTGPKPIKIAVLPVEDTMPMLVAKEKGYFAEEQLQVELVNFQSPVEQSNGMQSGEMDGMQTDMIVAALLKDSGLDLKITSITLGVTPQEGRFAILASPQSNINSLEDLKGKNIGISYNSIIEYVTDGLLTAGGIDPAEVKKTAIPKIPVRMEMLFSNQIDAIVVPDPLVSFAEHQGAKVIAQDTEKNLSQNVLFFTQKTIEENRDGVEAFYRAYRKAVDDLNDHPEDFRTLLVENINIPEPIADAYQLQHYPQPQVPGETDVQNILDWMNKKALLKNDLKYQDLVQEIKTP